ncbi:MAG TPA: porin [Bradyrhizobium sp.]|uniref:porin n=1 Tax=Bradyrhizobium sp. TaxID=376 RepID=UPI002B97CB1E|nr:porin [Bradyrhizobium sp.]HXB80485.1 porin [Bradyrhizobium sp.]
MLGAPGARADDSAALQRLEVQVQRLEARHESEIKALQAEIRRLRRQKGETEKPGTVTATRSPPADQPRSSTAPSGVPSPALPAKVLMTYDRGYHFGFSDATGDNTVELFGRLQLDAGGYTNYQPAPATLDRKGLSDGLDLRRARLGVIGTFMTDWHYAFVYDFGNSSDSSNANNALASANSGTSPTTSNTFLSGVENAFLTYNGFYKHDNLFPTAFDFGIMDVPWTLEEATSSNDLMFLERSTAQVIATSFGGGDFRSAIDVRSNNDRYWLGAFLTGPNSGALHTAGASCNTGTVAVTPGTPCVTSAQMTGLGPQLAFLARGAYQLVQEQDATFHVGFNYANLFAPRVGPNLAAVLLADRPELRVDPTSFLATGNIPASGGQVYGVEVAGSYKNLFAQGEYYHYVVDTRAGVPTVPGNLQGGIPGPALNFDGGYAQASYSIGGTRHYDPTRGAYTGVIPETPMMPGSSGWGALELATRYTFVNLNSPYLTTATLGPAFSAPGVFTGGTTTYGGGKETSYGIGLNWYPNYNMKFMLDYEHVVVDNPQFFGGANYRGATIDWIAARSQIVF